MKKLQIMAGMLSVLLLAGCGGAGASAKTTEGDPPQVASAAASGTTAAQNGNENPSEVVTQDEAERPGPVDAEPSGEKKTNSSAGEAKPAAEVPPVQVLPAETVPPETPPTGSAPSEPVTDEAAPQPEEKAFAMDYWLAYAKDYAVIAVAHNAADLPLHLTGRKGMPVRQAQVIPPGIVVVCDGIVVFLRCAGFDAVSYLALPGVQTPELRVAGSPYPVAKPQIQYTVAPVTAGLQGII